MSVNKDKSSQQWQLTVIQKIETVSDWLSTPERKKKVIILQGVFLGTLLLWGMFFVPTTILQESAVARNLVQITASIFPWIDMTRINYGVIADKFVYWQCISVWVLISLNLISSIAYRKFMLNKKVRGEEFYHSAFVSVAAIIFLFIGAVILPNCFHSDYAITRVQNAFMFNEYTSSAGAVMTAYLFDFLVMELVIVSFYLIHYFRNFKSFFKY
ncbi:MAG: hypothetical protein ABL880_02385 [Methylotenera sp.]